MHSRGNPNSDHRRHDRLLVTRFAAGDSYQSEQTDAEALVASCSECAALAADIRLLSSRARELPKTRRPRDFRLSQEQAEHLRGSWLQRLMRGFASPGWTVVRPLAGAAFAIGLTIAVVGALPASTPLLQRAADNGAAAATPLPALAAPPSDFAAPVASPNEMPGPTGEIVPLQPGDPMVAGGGDANVEPPQTTDRSSTAVPTERDGISNVYVQQSAAPEPGTPQTKGEVAVPAAASTDGNRGLLIGGGIGLAVLGLGLLLVAWLARRRYADPLLR